MSSRNRNKPAIKAVEAAPNVAPAPEIAPEDATIEPDVAPAPEITPEAATIEPDVAPAPEVAPEDDDFKAEAAKVFKVHPTVPELFFASDGTPFFAEPSAKAYASKLKDKETVRVKNRNLK